MRIASCDFDAIIRVEDEDGNSYSRSTMKRFIPKRILMLGVAVLIPLQGLGGEAYRCVSDSHTVASSHQVSEPSPEKVDTCCCREPSPSSRPGRETANATCRCSSSCGCRVQRDSDSRDPAPAEGRLPEQRRRTIDQIVDATNSVEGRSGSEGLAPATDADTLLSMTPDLCVLLCRFRL